MLIKFTGWSTFSQRPGGDVFVDAESVAALEGTTNGRGIDWTEVHLKSGKVIHVYEDVVTVKTRLKL